MTQSVNYAAMDGSIHIDNMNLSNLCKDKGMVNVNASNIQKDNKTGESGRNWGDLPINRQHFTLGKPME